MKITSTLHGFVFLMVVVVIVLYMPFTLLSQQGTNIADAVASAEQDAKAAVNQTA